MPLSSASRAAVALGSVLVAWALAEVALATLATGPDASGPAEAWTDLVHRASDVPGLAYELRPGAEARNRGVAVTVNSHGMRDREPAPLGTPGLARIAVVGDSNTFGFAVEARHAWPSVLERELNAAAADGAPRYETLNFGVGGYSTRDEALVVRHEALAFEPALVVIGYTLNDVEPAGSQPLQRHFAPRPWWERSRVLSLVARRRGPGPAETGGADDRLRDLYAPDGEAWRSVVEGFADIAEATGERGVPVLLVIFPRLYQLGKPRYPSADLHAQVARAAEEAGFAVLDLAPVFAEHPVARLANERDRAHPSVFGHRVAAEAVRERIAGDTALLAGPWRERE